MITPALSNHVSSERIFFVKSNIKSHLNSLEGLLFVMKEHLSYKIYVK